MDNYLQKASDSGLLDVIKEWIKTEKEISTSKIQRLFSVGYRTATSIINYLVEENLIVAESSTSTRYKVVCYSPGIKIYLLDRNPLITNEWRIAFKDEPEVTIAEDDFESFMNSHEVECIVSPANSWGIMTGGYDLAITNYFGNSLQAAVQRYIRHNFYGEQPVATSFIIDIPNTKQKLIHTPTMQMTKTIKDDFVVYQCMRTTLITAFNNKIKSIVIPAFGGQCGKVPPKMLAQRMKEAYLQICSNLK